MARARGFDTATLLLDGRVLITGGNDAKEHSVALAELYDPKTGTFSPTGSMTTARGFHNAIRAPGWSGRDRRRRLRRLDGWPLRRLG